MPPQRLLLKIAGEIGTKSSRTRRRFLRILVRNVRAAMEAAGVEGAVEPRWSHLIVETEDPGAAREALAGVFGRHSISEIAVLRFEGLDDLVERAAGLYAERVAGRTFAVRAKRSGTHDFSSSDVRVRLGSALLAGSGGVNLDDPEVEVRLEIADAEAFAFIGATPGARGLPLGSGHRAVALFSGGFDSPVAAWMGMRRGTEVELLICDLDGCGSAEAALEVAWEMTRRWAPGMAVRANVVDLVPVVAALRERVESGLRQVLLKRAMYRAGTILARASGADAILTGESLGQVSTQTLRNLAVAEEAAGVPVLRPLIGMDKEEIIARAREIGTHDASARVREVCAIATGRVETAAKLRDVLGAEGEVDDAFIATAVRARRRIDLRSWAPPPAPGHQVDVVPAGSVIVDVRELDEGPTAAGARLPFSRARDWLDGLDPSRTYLFVCSHGVRSGAVAVELARRGVRAFSLAGGTARHSIRAA